MHGKQAHSLPKASCASDISRILDPAYSSLSSHFSESSVRHVYKDCGGQLHDPDYRHFELPHPHLVKPKLKHQQDRLAWEIEAAALDPDEDLCLVHHQRRHSFSMREFASSTPSSPAFPSTPSLVEDAPTDHHNMVTETLNHAPAWRKDSHHHIDASEALHRQWLALSLRVRFKIFKMKRRLHKS